MGMNRQDMKMEEAGISHGLEGVPGPLSERSIAEKKRSWVGLGNGLGALIALGVMVSTWLVYRKNSCGIASKKTDLSNTMTRRIRGIDVEMDEEMKREAINCALEAFERFAGRKDVAWHIRFHFQKKYGGYWQCIVGDFGCDFTCKAGHGIYFEHGAEGVLLFKV